MLPKTPPEISLRNNRIKMLFRKVVSDSRAQNTFEKSRAKHGGVAKLVNKKFDNGSQDNVKKPYSKKTVPWS